MTRNLKFSTAIILILLFINPSFCMSLDDNPKIEKKVQKIISSMSLDEKISVIIGTGRTYTFSKITNPKGYPVAPGYLEMAARIKQYLPGAAACTAEYPELGISTQILADGPAGLRIYPTRENTDKTFYCTAFPTATMIASSWDTNLAEKIGKAMGNEVLEYGTDILLAPGMNIQRDPLCGRNFEYYSEDPLVSGKMAASMVNGVQSNGVGTSIKHFAANNQEKNRFTGNSVVSQRALREIYLRGFEIAVKEAQPWTVMTCYNKVNGTFAPQNYDLLTKVLREDWGFNGYVMTDWDSGDNIIEMVKAGNDLIAPGGQIALLYQLKEAVNNGELTEEEIDRNLARILKIMLKSPRYNKYEYSSSPDLKAHAVIARQAATEGMILLENKNRALPLSGEGKNVAVFGVTSYDFVAGGTGSGDVHEAYTISLMQGLENAGYKTDKKLSDFYLENHVEVKANNKVDDWSKPPVRELIIEKDKINTAAIDDDFALITIGRNAGEGRDRKPVAGDFYLSTVEKELVKNVSDAFHAKNKKVIVVINSGGVIETQSWTQWPDAVVVAWQPGQEAGDAVMDVLTGKVNPSGKLAISFPVLYSDAPSSLYFEGHDVPSTGDERPIVREIPRPASWEHIYSDDIYVGYRYYNTFDIPVSYEFGYGLSYTTFKYTNMKLSDSEFKDEITVSVDVTNTGEVAGKEVVQIYISAPDGKLEKPEEILGAFGKTGLLQPNETETLTFNIKSRDFASFDEATSSWIVEAGTYSVKSAASSLLIKQEVSFEVSNEIIVEKVNNALKPEVGFYKLSRE